MKLDTWSDSNIGLIRKSNQDAVGCYPELPLFIVADGMGGRSEGEVAAHMAVEVIHDYFARASSAPAGLDAGEPQATLARFLRGLFPRARGDGNDGSDEPHATRLRAAVTLANERIFDAGQQRSGAGQPSMGTTVVVLDCAVDQRRVFWAHVGDSRLYRVRGGEMTLLTADHTLLGEAFWNQPSVPSDLPHTNRLVRALGILPEVEISTGSDDLRGGDLFLLCSDGVSGMVKPDVLRDELIGADDLEGAGRGLIEKALEAGGKDNATLLLVRARED